MTVYFQQRVLLFILTYFVALTAASINIPLHRRGGRFVSNSPANLTRLANILAEVENKYAQSYRAAADNHLVRRWSPVEDAVDDEHLMDCLNREGAWFVRLNVGSPPQTLEFDIDMLAPDFYSALTTSSLGSKYDTFASKTYESGAPVHALCSSSGELFNLTSVDAPIRLQLPICIAPKTSSLTLKSSGSVLGLGLPGSLSRLQNTGLLAQLKQKTALSEDSWSMTILDAETGILSLGGNIAKEVEEAKIRADLELKHFDDSQANAGWIQQQVETAMGYSMPAGSLMETHFKWSPIKGASGWWTSLATGIWVRGAKILKNQPVLFDVQCPFVLAPPKAASQFYEAVGGSKRLPSPNDMFFAFPCSSQTEVVLELGGWSFPSMSGETTRADAINGPAGGRLSLGKLYNGTGFCVGAVVESRMGTKQKWANAGVHGVWVLGEPFFRDMGVVFDYGTQRIGFRSY